MRASAGAGVTMGLMDVPNSVKEFELAAEAMARGVWVYFLDLAARCFFTSTLLIGIVYSYCCLLTWRIIVWSEARRAEGEKEELLSSAYALYAECDLAELKSSRSSVTKPRGGYLSLVSRCKAWRQNTSGHFVAHSDDR